MKPEELDRTADAMVGALVRDFNATATDANGDLLWSYFRQILKDVALDCVDQASSLNQQAIRTMRDSVEHSFERRVAELRQRKSDLESDNDS